MSRRGHYSFSDIEEARTACRWANANLPHFHPSNLGHHKIVSRFEVRNHAWLPSTGTPCAWGVWPVWAYDDRPDLSDQFGGPFTPLEDIPL